MIHFFYAVLAVALPTGEFLLDDDIIIRAAAGDQEQAAVAFDGTNYLAVWTDMRDDFDRNIYGARVARDGVVLDPGGILICRANGEQCLPAVAFDGANYLVVWTDLRATWDFDIYGARVDRNGRVLDTAGIRITNATYEQLCPAVAYNGTDFLVLWQDRRNTFWDIYGTRVRSSGQVLDTVGFPITLAPNGQHSPALACDQTNGQALVIWHDSRNGAFDLYGSRVDRNGVVLDSFGLAVSTASGDQSFPAVAFGGNNYFVTWQDSRSGNFDLYGARVDRSGTVLDPSGLVLSAYPGSQCNTALAFDRTNYVVVWDDARAGIAKIYGCRVTQTGTVIDPNGMPLATSAGTKYYPTIAAADTQLLISWDDGRHVSGDLDIYGARLTSSGVNLDTAGILLSNAPYGQSTPAAVDNPTRWCAVVWSDARSADGCPDIFGARVDWFGSVLDTSAVCISAAPRWQEAPTLAIDGNLPFAVWQDSRNGQYDIYGTLLDPLTMQPLQPSGIPICTAPGDQRSPAVAFDGANFIVAWQDERSGNADIYAARVNRSGIVIDTTAISIAATSFIEGEPAVAASPTNALVAWHRGHSHDFDIYATRIDQSGRILDPGGIPISTAQSEQLNPRVTYGLGNYLVAWQDIRYVYYDIFATRVTSSGVVLDPDGIIVTHALHHQDYPDVACKSLFGIVWQDKRSQVETDIYGARMSAQGNVWDSTIVSSQRSNQITPALAAWGSGFLCLYSGWTDSLQSRPAHTMRIWGEMIYVVGIEETAEDRLSARAHLTIHPNPFVKLTKVGFSLEQGAKDAELKIYDVSGRVVKRFNHLTITPFNQITWDGSDDFGLNLPAGIYIATLIHGRQRWTQKIIKLE